MKLYLDRTLVPKSGMHALLVSHDLSASGAPRVLYEIARILRASNMRVTVLSPADGFYRDPFVKIGATVVIEPTTLLPASDAVQSLGKDADFAICNTVVAAEAVRVLSVIMPTYWYIHEISFMETLLSDDRKLAGAFALPLRVWAGSELPASIIRKLRPDVRVLPYGLDPLSPSPIAPVRDKRPAAISMIGSIEQRKGQDIAVQAVKMLPESLRGSFALNIYGRVLDEEFVARLFKDAEDVSEVTVHSELDEAAYVSAILESDAVLLASRDDTLPLVSLDALGVGRILLCTPTTGTAAYITNGSNGFVAEAADAEAVSAMLAAALGKRQEWHAIGSAARSLFADIFSRKAFVAQLEAELQPALSRVSAPTSARKQRPYPELRTVPRFQERTVSLLNKPFRIADCASFLASYQEIFEDQIYRFDTAKVNPLIIDCGANYGVSVMYFKTLYSRARIFAIEADPAIFEMLKFNVLKSGFTDIQLINRAVSGDLQPVRFHSQGADAGRTHTLEGATNVVEVGAVTLDQMIGGWVDLLKLDIEGAETSALKACTKLHKVRNIFIEYHSFSDSPQTLADILSLLSSNGFRYHIQTQFCPRRPLISDEAHLGMDLQLNIFAKRPTST